MRKVIVGTRGTSQHPEFAGSTWVRLQYLLGLQKLGLEVYWIDRITEVHPHKGPHTLEYLMKRFERMTNDFGLAGRWCVIYNEGERHFGMADRELEQLCDSADLLINISGHLPASSPLMRVPRRAYIDVDPGFTQIWAHEVDMGFDRHNFFFTIGQNVGSDSFTIPTRDIDWKPMLPPVYMEMWPARIDERCTRFSTVADWRTSQGKSLFQDQVYGGKRPEFIRCLHLPIASGAPLEIALCIAYNEDEDLGLLHAHGWRVLDPYLYAGDPHSYREFIQFSRAEFSVAKSGYVKSNSGWISDRTACYLASGKPALVQSTGLEAKLPTGMGLVTFRTLEEAVAGIQAINADYTAHCHAARELAEKAFDSNIVLASLLEHVGL